MTGTYYLRRAVPADLHPTLGLEMKVSLDTRERIAAQLNRFAMRLRGVNPLYPIENRADSPDQIGSGSEPI